MRCWIFVIVEMFVRMRRCSEKRLDCDYESMGGMVGADSLLLDRIDWKILSGVRRSLRCLRVSLCVVVACAKGVCGGRINLTTCTFDLPKLAGSLADLGAWVHHWHPQVCSVSMRDASLYYWSATLMHRASKFFRSSAVIFQTTKRFDAIALTLGHKFLKAPKAHQAMYQSLVHSVLRGCGSRTVRSCQVSTTSRAR